MKIVLVTALLLMTTTAHAAIPCQTSGKAWRLIDGKRCWHMGHRSTPKTHLYWAKTRQVSLPSIPEPRTRGRPRITPPVETPVETAVGETTPTLLAGLQARAEAIRAASPFDGITVLRTRNDNPIAPVETVQEPVQVKPVRIVLPGAPKIAEAKVAEIPVAVPAKAPPEVPNHSLMVLLLLTLLLGHVSILGSQNHEHRKLYQ